MLIRNVFSGYKKNGYTQSQAVDHARVSLYLWVIFVISLLFPMFETQRKQRFKQVFYHYSTEEDKEAFF